MAETTYANMMCSASTEPVDPGQRREWRGQDGVGQDHDQLPGGPQRPRRRTYSEVVAEAVIRSTPLLETFGNSKTLRINNSSRGKFTQVHQQQLIIPLILLPVCSRDGAEERWRRKVAFICERAGCDTLARLGDPTRRRNAA